MLTRRWFTHISLFIVKFTQQLEFKQTVAAAKYYANETALSSFYVPWNIFKYCHWMAYDKLICKFPPPPSHLLPSPCKPRKSLQCHLPLIIRPVCKWSWLSKLLVTNPGIYQYANKLTLKPSILTAHGIHFESNQPSDSRHFLSVKLNFLC